MRRVVVGPSVVAFRTVAEVQRRVETSMKSCMADVVEADGDHPAQMAFGIQLGYQIGFQVH